MLDIHWECLTFQIKVTLPKAVHMCSISSRHVFIQTPQFLLQLLLWFKMYRVTMKVSFQKIYFPKLSKKAPQPYS